MARKLKGGAGYEGGMIAFFLVVLVVLVLVAVIALKKEKFVTGPSATGDQKEVTPSGNVILY